MFKWFYGKYMNIQTVKEVFFISYSFSVKCKKSLKAIYLNIFCVWIYPFEQKFSRKTLNLKKYSNSIVQIKNKYFAKP